MKLLNWLLSLFDPQDVMQLRVSVPLGSGYDRAKEEEAIRSRLVSQAEVLLGVKYRLGAEVDPKSDTMPEDIDCSELVEYCYAKNDLDMPDGSPQQMKFCVSVKEPKPGDLGFLWSDKWGRIGHVAMYVGNGEVIHAKGGTGVVRDKRSFIEQSPRFMGWGRHPDFMREAING